MPEKPTNVAQLLSNLKLHREGLAEVRQYEAENVLNSHLGYSVGGGLETIKNSADAVGSFLSLISPPGKKAAIEAALKGKEAVRTVVDAVVLYYEGKPNEAVAKLTTAWAGEAGKDKLEYLGKLTETIISDKSPVEKFQAFVADTASTFVHEKLGDLKSLYDSITDGQEAMDQALNEGVESRRQAHEAVEHYERLVENEIKKLHDAGYDENGQPLASTNTPGAAAGDNRFRAILDQLHTLTQTLHTNLHP